MKRFAAVCLAMVVAGVLTACGGGGGGTGGGNPGSGATISSISITPGNSSGSTGNSIAFTATALMSDATSSIVTASATWNSSNAAVAQFSTVNGARNVVSLVSAGTATITAIVGTLTASTLLTVSTGTVTAPSANPLSVTPILDAGRAVSSAVTTTGGTITATAADGSVMTLVIPAGALVSTVTITVTPVSSIGGLPMDGGLVAGVEMEPSGLAFYKPVSLTIQPAASVPVANQVTFGYHESGAEFHLEPPVISGSAITLKLLRFCGEGVANGTPANVAAQLLQVPTSSDDFIAQSLYQLVSAERQAQLNSQPGDPDFASKFQALMDEWENLEVMPRILNASSSCAAAREALSYVLSLERNRQILGVSAPNDSATADATISSLIATIGQQCIQEAYNQCVATGNVARMFQAVLGLEREKQLLGTSDGSTVPEGADLAEKCASWQVDFDSDMLWVSSGTTINVEVTSSKIPFQWKYFTGGTTQGTGPLTYKQASISDPDSSLQGTGSIAGVWLEMDLNMNASAAPADPLVQLAFDTGNPQPLEILTMCFPAPTGCVSAGNQAYWSAPWLLSHMDTLGEWFGGAIHGTLMFDFTEINGMKKMKKTYTGVVNGAPDVLETTYVTIYHTPQ